MQLHAIESSHEISKNFCSEIGALRHDSNQMRRVSTFQMAEMAKFEQIALQLALTLVHIWMSEFDTTQFATTYSWEDFVTSSRPYTTNTFAPGRDDIIVAQDCYVLFSMLLSGCARPRPVYIDSDNKNRSTIHRMSGRLQMYTPDDFCGFDF